MQSLLAGDAKRFLKNLVRQLVIFRVGRGMTFSDREQINAIVDRLGLEKSLPN